jgi:hypothetical protein
MVLQKYDQNIEDKRYMLINPKDDYLSLALQIVELGFKVDTLDKYGKTALQKELERKNFTNAEFLLNCGASLNIFDEHHRSLFHIEVLKGYSNNKIIDFLIQKGANLNQRDKYFRTIIDNLIELILISKGEKPRNPSLDEYVQEDGGFDILLKKLLVYEADISYTRVDGKNIVFDLVNLHVYSKFDSRDEIKTLIELEPDWDKLLNRNIVEQLFHINKHYDLIKRVKPKSILDLAECLALIRPQKMHLTNLYINDKQKALKYLWLQDDDGYAFKKAHAISYAMVIVLQLHLL